METGALRRVPEDRHHAIAVRSEQIPASIAAGLPSPSPSPRTDFNDSLFRFARGTLRPMTHPVELLRDAKGIYGIGVTKNAEVHERVTNLILRPDRLDEGAEDGAI